MKCRSCRTFNRHLEAAVTRRDAAGGAGVAGFVRIVDNVRRLVGVVVLKEVEVAVEWLGDLDVLGQDLKGPSKVLGRCDGTVARDVRRRRLEVAPEHILALGTIEEQLVPEVCATAWPDGQDIARRQLPGPEVGPDLDTPEVMGGWVVMGGGDLVVVRRSGGEWVVGGGWWDVQAPNLDTTRPNGYQHEGSSSVIQTTRSGTTVIDGVGGSERPNVSRADET